MNETQTNDKYILRFAVVLTGNRNISSTEMKVHELGKTPGCPGIYHISTRNAPCIFTAIQLGFNVIRRLEFKISVYKLHIILYTVLA